MSKRFIQQQQARIAELEAQNQRLSEKVQQLMAPPHRAAFHVAPELEQNLRRQVAMRKAAEEVAMVATEALQNSLGHLAKHDPQLAGELLNGFVDRMNQVKVNVHGVKLAPFGQMSLPLFSESEPLEAADDPAHPPQELATEAATVSAANDADGEPPAAATGSESFGTPSTPKQREKLDNNRNAGGRRRDRDLPAYDWHAELDPADQVCAECGGNVQDVASLARTSTMIGCLPMEIVKVAVTLHTYRCMQCGHLETASPPPRASVKGMCSLELGAWCAAEKYDFHMPLHRTERRLDLLDSRLSAQNQFDMIASMAAELKKTRQGILDEILRTSPVIHIDQTPWKNLQPGASRDFQLWCVSTPKLAWYGIEHSKGRIVFDRLLASYAGVIVADAASTHLSAFKDHAQRWRLALCWAHLLRRFRDIGPLVPQASRTVELIHEIFAAEKRRPPDADRSSVVPLVEAFFEWLRSLVVLPRTSLESAVGYALGHEQFFRTFLTDTAIPMTNNAAERDIRPVVVGRNNHGGSRSPAGVMTAETFYTMCTSARRNGVKPADYIHVSILRARENAERITLPWDVVEYPHLLPATYSIARNALRVRQS